MRTLRPIIHFTAILLCAFATNAAASENELLVASPNKSLEVRFQLTDQGAPQFVVNRGDQQIVQGQLGLQFAGAPALDKNFEVTGVEHNTIDDTYAIPVGKASSARDQHNELIITLQDKSSPSRQLKLGFRAFDDGVAFRYLIPKQGDKSEFILIDELTELEYPPASTAHALPLNNYTTPYEQYYETLPVSAITSDKLLGLPLVIERPADNGSALWLAVTEADLTDYAGMYLSGVKDKPGALAARLSPLPGRTDGAKVVAQAPHASPWRVIMIADNPGRFLESNLIFHLNPPSPIADTSWIKPGKTTFPWWNGYVLEGVDFTPGLNTSTYKHYIDFCAEHGIEYHSLDGTDTAWYGGPITPNGPTDVTKAVPEIDLPELLRYAKQKGVGLRLWMHWKALKPQLDEALATYQKWGVEGIMVDFMDRDDQEMVNWYHEVAQKAAAHHLTVTWHGAYKPTGMERTWPNVLNYEAALNQEYNKWSPVGTPPEHNLNVALVRGIAGPVDYHHGGFRNVLPENHRPHDKAPDVQGTRGHQLALYVVYQNALPMMVDYPAAYRGQPGLDFITRVPTSWDETRVLHASFKDGLIITRRKGNAWYLGGITAKQPLDIALPLEFLGQGKYAAQVTLDDPPHGATALTTQEQTVTAADKLRIAIPRAGGFIAILKPAN